MSPTLSSLEPCVAKRSYLLIFVTKGKKLQCNTHSVLIKSAFFCQKMVHCAQQAMLSWDQTWALRPTCLERRELFHFSCLRLCWSHDFRLAFRRPPSLLPQRWKGHWHHCSAPSALTQCWASRGEKKKNHGSDDVSEIISRLICVLQ